MDTCTDDVTYGLWMEVCISKNWRCKEDEEKRVSVLFGEPERKCTKQEEESRDKRRKKRKWLKAKRRREEEGKMKDERKEKEK